MSGRVNRLGHRYSPREGFTRVCLSYDEMARMEVKRSSRSCPTCRGVRGTRDTRAEANRDDQCATWRISPKSRTALWLKFVPAPVVESSQPAWSAPCPVPELTGSTNSGGGLDASISLKTCCDPTLTATQFSVIIGIGHRAATPLHHLFTYTYSSPPSSSSIPSGIETNHSLPVPPLPPYCWTTFPPHPTRSIPPTHYASSPIDPSFQPPSNARSVHQGLLVRFHGQYPRYELHEG